MNPKPLLELRHLRVDVSSAGDTHTAVKDVTLSLQRGEVLGLVGESGAGKSLVAAAATGLLPPGAHHVSGTVHLAEQSIGPLERDMLRRYRGRYLGAVFQEAMNCLNPLLTIEEQLVETLCTHHPISTKAARRRAVDLLMEVGLGSGTRWLGHYGHQLSGGMRQRVAVALALCGDPTVLIADEPTSALDVTHQSRLLALLLRLREDRRLAILLITHDLRVVRTVSDRIAVMYAGRIVETGRVDEVLSGPQHPYTRGLVASVPSTGRGPLAEIAGVMSRPGDAIAGCAFNPRCPLAEGRCVSEVPPLEQRAGGAWVACWVPSAPTKHPERASFDSKARLGVTGGARSSIGGDDANVPILRVTDLEVVFGGPTRPRDLFSRNRRTDLVRAVDRVSFDVNKGEFFGLVGESGCGKSTLARALVGLQTPTGGGIAYRDPCHPSGASRDDRDGRLQMVFQDPVASLDPRWRVHEIVAEPLGTARTLPQRKRLGSRVASMLSMVGLSADDASKFPHQFSGGQRQRIAIARALIGEPDVLVCDEPTSSLDVSIQAQILNLLWKMKLRQGLSCVLISHDLAIVQRFADRVAVMFGGRLVEIGAADRLYQAPEHPYTRAMRKAFSRLESQPMSTGAAALGDSLVISGCAFEPRCSFANGRCRSERPELRPSPSASEGLIACHGVEERRIPDVACPADEQG